MNQLFIPSKIKVGYQKRGDTYSKRLAYVIYYDSKGVLRKQTSWDGWRDKKIAADEFDNTPQEGIILNKGVERCNWGHFSSGRSYIRVYDPRGIEFEIQVTNLMYILMHVDCNKRQFEGTFVYAWWGKDLILLPTNSEEYVNSVKYTELQGKKISAKDLVPGCFYKTKKEKDFMYVGRYMWYEWNAYRETSRIGKRYHIFTNDGGKSFLTKNDTTFLAERTTESPVADFADVVERFQNNVHANKIVKWEVVPIEVDFTEYGDLCLKNPTYFKLNGNQIDIYSISINKRYDSTEYKYKFVGYEFRISRYIDTVKQVIKYKETDRSYNYWKTPSSPPIYSKEGINQQGFGALYVIFENGKRKRIDYLDKI